MTFTSHRMFVTPLDESGMPLTDEMISIELNEGAVTTTDQRWYIAVCKNCHGDDPQQWLSQPFRSSAERWTWAVAHTDGTGHDRWVMFDHD